MHGAGGNNTMHGAGRNKTMRGAGGNNPMVQGDIEANTGAFINLGNIAGNINLGTEEYQLGSTKTFPPRKIVGETTALKNLREIEECLMDDEVGKIGVFGMGGVGKTTIMINIHNNIKNAGTFDHVIWVTVSKESDLEELQGLLSKALGIRDFSKYKDVLWESAKLFEAFEGKGKFLLILDDMWSTFSLTKVGIPEPNQENKCKIVWTTRSKKVCQGMCSQRIIEVNTLTKDESWTLFKEKLGTDFVLSPEIEQIAKTVVEECDGLPLGIITVGAAMRGVDDIRIWRNALEHLKNSRPDLEGLEKDVFSCLRFSFDHLRTQIHRDCFLYCALYREDVLIECDSLIEKWMADGFFDEIEDREKGFDKGYTIINDLKDACMLEKGELGDFNRSFVRMHDKGYTIINDLKDACMLEKGELGDFNRSFVRMHDLLRDLAIDITRKSRQFVVKVSSNVGKFPRDENLMDDAIRVSLMDSNIELLSCRSKFPKLSTLLLGGSSLGNIDDFFFDHMQNLRVLDLTNADITCLPQSLSNLVNLHALLLKHCSTLRKVPSLVHLTELRVLDLSGTSIKYLPDGMDSLTNLRCLDLSATRSLEMVPVGAISSFSHLEVLLMTGSKWKWSSNEDRNGRGAGVGDIERLLHLKKLLVDFVDSSAFSSYVRSGHWRGLNCFLLIVGYGAEDLVDSQYNFYSRECGVFVSDSDCMNSVAFPESNLTKLLIAYTYNLSTICMEERTHGDNLANLRYINIKYCPELEYVLLVRWFQTLQNLEEIFVYRCDAMEEMVVDKGDMSEANNNIPITLPRLKRLILSHLPNLKSICKRTLICSSLEEILVLNCPMLKTLPFSINSLSSSLKRIKGSRRWWDSLEWDNANTKMHLEDFFLPVVDDKLHLFPVLADISRLEEDQERQGTKRKADSHLLDLNLPPLSLVQQHEESEPRELSPRNWLLWKTRE